MARTLTATQLASTALRIQTLGGFHVWRNEVEIEPIAWGREKALHLFQFLVTMRRRPLHKEEIIDRLWPELDSAQGDRDFKVALNGIYQALEPEREPRSRSRYIVRYDLAYGLNPSKVQVDADALEEVIAEGNQLLPHDVEAAIERYRAAAALYTGDYLPERHYEDWSSAERERLQTLALGTMTTLANLLVDSNPPESLRLTQTVLARDPVWEDAYRIQMKVHLAQGNRAKAIQSYQRCAKVLETEFGLEPLPATRALYEATRGRR